MKEPLLPVAIDGAAIESPTLLVALFDVDGTGDVGEGLRGAARPLVDGGLHLRGFERSNRYAFEATEGIDETELITGNGTCYIYIYETAVDFLCAYGCRKGDGRCGAFGDACLGDGGG